MWIRLGLITERKMVVEEEEKVSTKNRPQKVWDKWKNVQNKTWEREGYPSKIRGIDELEEELEEWYNKTKSGMKEHFGRKKGDRHPIAKALENDTELHKLKKEERRERREINSDLQREVGELKRLTKAIETKKRTIIKEAMKKVAERTNEALKNNPSKIYRILKGVGKAGKRLYEQPYAVKEKTTITSEAEKVWAEMYKTRGEKREDPPWLREVRKAEKEAQLTGEITKDELDEAIKGLKNNKAEGTDGISNEILKNTNELQ